jgi:hypothetical protein
MLESTAFGELLIEYGVRCAEDGSLRQGLLVSATTLKKPATQGTQTQPRILGKEDSFRVSVGVHLDPCATLPTLAAPARRHHALVLCQKMLPPGTRREEVESNDSATCTRELSMRTVTSSY